MRIAQNTAHKDSVMWLAVLIKLCKLVHCMRMRVAVCIGIRHSALIACNQLTQWRRVLLRTRNILVVPRDPSKLKFSYNISQLDVLLGSRSSNKVECRPVKVVLRCLLNIFAVRCGIWRPKNAPCRGNKGLT